MTISVKMHLNVHGYAGTFEAGVFYDSAGDPVCPDCPCGVDDTYKMQYCHWCGRVVHILYGSTEEFRKARQRCYDCFYGDD